MHGESDPHFDSAPCKSHKLCGREGGQPCGNAAFTSSYAHWSHYCATAQSVRHRGASQLPKLAWAGSWAAPKTLPARALRHATMVSENRRPTRHDQHETSGLATPVLRSVVLRMNDAFPKLYEKWDVKGCMRKNWS